MAKNKNQHYVPQFYLRNFSSTGRSLNLLNISTGKIIVGDSIKNQCSEDYFYGRTILIEKAFGEIETNTGRMLKRVINDNYIPLAKTQDHTILQLFIVTLHSRTKYKLEEMNEMVDRIGKSVLELHPDVEKNLLDKLKIQLDFPLHYSILNSLTRYHLIQDLQMHIFINKSSDNFITSDHPIVLYNKWAEDIKDFGAVGLASKGLLIFLPLNPRKLLLLYDSNVYKIGNRKDVVTTINNSEEIKNINLLQWLKCQDNIYFFSENEQDKIKNNAKVNIILRQQSKTSFTERKGPNGSKIIGGFSSKLKMKLNVNSIKIRKQSKQIKINEKIHAIRNPKLLDLVNEFGDLVRARKYSATEWNKFLEDKIM